MILAEMSAGQFQTSGGLIEDADLCLADIGADGIHRIDHRDQPTGRRHERDWNIAIGQGMEPLSGYLHAADHSEAFQVCQRDFACLLSVFVRDFHRHTTDADARAVLLGNDMKCIVANRPDAARAWRFFADPLLVDLIGQADRLQRAAETPWIIDQRQRPFFRIGGIFSSLQRAQCLLAQSGIDGNPQTQFLGGVIENRFWDGVSRFLQKDGLQSHLHPVCRPRFGDRRRWFVFARIIGRCPERMTGSAFAVFDGNGDRAVNLSQVQCRCQSQRRACERQTAHCAGRESSVSSPLSFDFSAALGR